MNYSTPTFQRLCDDVFSNGTDVVSTTVTLDTAAGTTVASAVMRVPSIRFARRTFLAASSGNLVIGLRRVSGVASDCIMAANAIVREVGSPGN